MSQQPKIFISYRRRDEPDFVGRMYDHFVCRYGEKNVFMDLDIPDFTRFKEYIIKEVDKSDVLVAVIGPKWLELLKEKSESDEPDFVVMEIKRALDKGIMVAPICIKDASMPKKGDLPSEIPEIQKVLDYHIPRVRGESDFRDDMRKRIGCIEQELEKLGCKFDDRTELDKILDQSLEELENDIFELLEKKNNSLRIEKYLRELPSYFLNKASEKSQDDTLKTLTDKIIVFGVVFIEYDKSELYQKFLRTLQLIFEGAYERFRSPPSEYTDETRRIWTELLPKLYLLGAMLVQEDKYEWMSDFVKHPVIWWEDRAYYKGMYWMWCMLNVHGIDKAFLTRIINVGKENSYFYRQFLDDEEKITSCICQFDFVRYVYDRINVEASYRFFVRYSREWTIPIMQRIIEDTQFRNILWDGQLDDQKLAEIIRQLVNSASNIPHFWPGELNDSFPPEIMSFLKKNLP